MKNQEKRLSAFSARSAVNHNQMYWRWLSVMVLEEGKGRLFTDPDPDKAREFFRSKSRKMTNKVMSL